MGAVVLTGVSKEDLELTSKFSETGLSAQQFGDSLNKAHELVGQDLVTQTELTTTNLGGYKINSTEGVGNSQLKNYPYVYAKSMVGSGLVLV